MDISQHLSPASALAALASAGTEFVTLFAHGTLSVELFKPDGVDRQQPHTRDECYVIVSGSGEFVNDGRRTRFGPGDFLFVRAGAEHRFEHFTADFATWVLFYGPEGGERP